MYNIKVDLFTFSPLSATEVYLLDEGVRTGLTAGKMSWTPPLCIYPDLASDGSRTQATCIKLRSYVTFSCIRERNHVSKSFTPRVYRFGTTGLHPGFRTYIASTMLEQQHICNSSPILHLPGLQLHTNRNSAHGHISPASNNHNFLCTTLSISEPSRAESFDKSMGKLGSVDYTVTYR